MTRSPLHEALAAIVGAEDVLTRPIDLAAYASDASIYRIVPAAVVRPQTPEQIPTALHALPRARSVAHVPRGRNQFVGAGGHRGDRGRPVAALARRGGARPRAARARGPWCRRRGRERAVAAVRREDRAGPGLASRVHDGRDPGEQLERDVLWRAPERLPHARLAGVPAPLGDARRHGGRVRRRRTPSPGARARRRAARTAAHDPGDSRPLGPHPAQVPDEEHDRLLSQRVARLRSARRPARAPPDRIGGYAGVHRQRRAPHGPGSPGQVHGSAPLSHHARRLCGDRAAGQRRSRGARGHGPRRAAFRGPPERRSRGHSPPAS